MMLRGLSTRYVPQGNTAVGVGSKRLMDSTELHLLIWARSIDWTVRGCSG